MNNISHKTESSSWTYKRKHHIIKFLMWCNVCLPRRAVVARICLVSCELSSPGPKDARQHSFQITCFNLWLHASGSKILVLSFCLTSCNLMLTLVNYLNFVNKSDKARPQKKKSFCENLWVLTRTQEVDSAHSINQNVLIQIAGQYFDR